MKSAYVLLFIVLTGALLACEANPPSSGDRAPPDAAAATDLAAAPDSARYRPPDTQPDASADGARYGGRYSHRDAGADGRADGDESIDAGDGPPLRERVELLDDGRFRHGFKTYPANPSPTSIGTLLPPTATASPIWQLSEWYTQRLLTNGPPTMTELGAQWANAYKRVVIGDGLVELAVNADAEYGGRYRQAGEPWPHLLVEQRLYNASDPRLNTPIHRYASVILSVQLELVYARHLRDAGYDSSLHACQFLMYLTLQNRNLYHQDYGNFIWFGVPFYDDRYPMIEESVALDSGTDRYIYGMASRNILPQSLHEVSTVAVSVDLLPYMKLALETAIARGILKSTDWDDYFLGEMNMGFELPGRSIATMRVRNLSLRVERTRTP